MRPRAAAGGWFISPTEVIISKISTWGPEWFWKDRTSTKQNCIIQPLTVGTSFIPKTQPVRVAYRNFKALPGLVFCSPIPQTFESGQMYLLTWESDGT